MYSGTAPAIDDLGPCNVALSNLQPMETRLHIVRFMCYTLVSYWEELLRTNYNRSHVYIIGNEMDALRSAFTVLLKSFALALLRHVITVN